MNYQTFFALTFMLTCTALTSASQKQGATICANPASPCSSSYTFAPYQLPFEIKQKLVFGKTYKSVSFYAVVLKSVRTGRRDVSLPRSIQKRSQKNEETRLTWYLKDEVMRRGRPGHFASIRRLPD